MLKKLVIFIVYFHYQLKNHAIIADKYGVETKIFAMDFGKGNPEDFNKVSEIINSIPVGVLGKERKKKEEKRVLSDL